MKLHEVLTEARKLIEDPNNWTQGQFARGQDGYWLPPKSADAVCFCAVGAVERVVTGHCFLGLSAIVALGLQTGAENALKGHSMFARYAVVKFNDRNNHDAVLALFDRAIADAKSKDV